MKNDKKAWDRIFKEQGKFFKDPHEEMGEIVKLLKKKSGKRILDVGSGSGRHIVYLAKKGFDVYGIDISKTGIELTKDWLRQEGLSAKLAIHDITKKLPFKNDFFDGVISLQVIHHARFPTIGKIIKEIERVLRRGGFLFVSVPLYRGPITGSRKGKWRMKKIADHTYLPLSGPEKGLVHYYFTPEKFEESFNNFKIIKTYIDDTNHYCLLGFKK